MERAHQVSYQVSESKQQMERICAKQLNNLTETKQQMEREHNKWLVKSLQMSNNWQNIFSHVHLLLK
jgi:hypothetical protein